jgi:Fe-S cluster biogenesis protein NfuA
VSLFTRLFGRGPIPEPAPAEGDPQRVREVEAVLDELRGMFRADGGDVHLVWVREGVVGLKLHGACGGCAVSSLTWELALRP